MDFSTAYFGKPLTQLQFDDIANYFLEPKQETETIEFKSFHASSAFDKGLQGVIRGISAFLNSSGGILIWGAPSGKVQEGLSEKVFVGDLAPLAELKEKDSLINKVSSAITPLPIGVKVERLDNNGQYLYVFEVQPSMYKPHQYDNRYYVRLDGQTKPAPHYLVDALIKQVTYPNLNAIIKFHTLSYHPQTAKYTLPLTVAVFNFTQLQNEEFVSFRIIVTGAYFMRGRHFRVNNKTPQYNMHGQELVYENFANILHYGTPTVYHDELSIDSNSMKDNNGLVNIILSFGGKKSPARVSTYTLDFNKEINLNSPTDLIIDTELNVLFSELKQHANRSNQDTLDAFLKNY